MFNKSKYILDIFTKSTFPTNLMRKFSTTCSVFVKEISEIKDNNQLIIEGLYTESSASKNLLPIAKKPNFCPECDLGLSIKHTDVLILSQYVRRDGCMLPRRITGLCKRQQRKIGTLVTMAQKAGLMPNLAPANSKRDPKKRLKWKKFNTYYDESTIKC